MENITVTEVTWVDITWTDLTVTEKSSFNGGSDFRNPYDTLTRFIIYTYIFPIVLAVGLFGNVLFLVMMVRSRDTMRSTVNYYLTSLAFADIIMLATLANFYITLYNQYPLKNARVQIIVLFLSGFSCQSTSGLTIALLSHNLYNAICNPLGHLTSRSGKRTRFLIAATWIWGICIGILATGSWGWTTIHLERRRTYGLIFFIKCSFSIYSVTSIASFLINAYFFARTLVHLARKQANETSGPIQARRVGKARSKELFQIFKMISINAFVFYASLLPWVILQSNAAFGSEVPDVLPFPNPFTDLYAIAVTFQLTNSMMNPIIYGVFNSKYRSALRRALVCGKNASAKTQKKADVNTLSGPEIGEDMV